MLHCKVQQLQHVLENLLAASVAKCVEWWPESLIQECLDETVFQQVFPLLSIKGISM